MNVLILKKKKEGIYPKIKTMKVWILQNKENEGMDNNLFELFPLPCFHIFSN